MRGIKQVLPLALVCALAASGAAHAQSADPDLVGTVSEATCFKNSCIVPSEPPQVPEAPAVPQPPAVPEPPNVDGSVVDETADAAAETARRLADSADPGTNHELPEAPDVPTPPTLPDGGEAGCADYGGGAIECRAPFMGAFCATLVDMGAGCAGENSVVLPPILNEDTGEIYYPPQDHTLATVDTGGHQRGGAGCQDDRCFVRFTPGPRGWVCGTRWSSLRPVQHRRSDVTGGASWWARSQWRVAGVKCESKRFTQVVCDEKGLGVSVDAQHCNETSVTGNNRLASNNKWTIHFLFHGFPIQNSIWSEMIVDSHANWWIYHSEE